MAEEDNLARVKVSKHKNAFGVAVNFASKSWKGDGVPQLAQDLLALSDDWTASCIASLEHSPLFYGFGKFVVSKEVAEQLTSFLRETAVSSETVQLDDGSELQSFIVHEDDLAIVGKKVDSTVQMMRAATSIVRSQLSSVISEFEYFISRTLKVISVQHPKLFLSGDESIKLSQLADFSTIEEVRAYKVDAKISDKLRGSHADLVIWIGDTLKIYKESSLREDREFIDFIEVCQRRNLLAHNGGIVNKQYLECCQDYNVFAEDAPHIGDDLLIDSKYLRRSVARSYMIGLKILHMYLQKISTSAETASLSNLLSVSHDFLEVNLTKMARRVILFAKYKPSNMKNELRLSFAINEALTYLFDPKLSREAQTEKTGAVLDVQDWSVTTPTLDLALACVRRDFSNILNLAGLAHSSGLNYSNAATFCVFREAREIEGFMECFPKSLLMIQDTSNKQA